MSETTWTVHITMIFLSISLNFCVTSEAWSAHRDLFSVGVVVVSGVDVSVFTLGFRSITYEGMNLFTERSCIVKRRSSLKAESISKILIELWPFFTLINFGKIVVSD